MQKPATLNKKQRSQIESLCNENRLQEARGILIQIIQQAPGNIDAWLWLGRLSLQLSDTANAVSCFTKVLQTQPDNTAIQQQLAQCYLLLGREAIKTTPGNARELFSKARELDGANTQILTEYAALLSELHEFEQARLHFQRVVELLPDRAASHSNLAIAYEKSGNIAFAIEHYQQAHELAADNISYTLNYAHALNVTGQYAQAESLLATVLKLEPDNIKAIVEQIILYVNTDRTEVASSLLRPYLDMDVRAVPVTIITVCLRLCDRLNLCDEAITLAEDYLSCCTPDQPETDGLYFYMGRLLDKRGDYDRAFGYIEKGNQLKDTHSDRHIAQMKALSHYVAVFNKDMYDSCSSSGNTSEIPVFIVGMPRSGTSLIEQILDSHPDMHGVGENGLLNRYLQEYIAQHPQNTQMAACLTALTEGQLQQMATRYLEAIQYQSGGHPYDRIINKLPDNFRLLTFIKKLFPRARIIHCSRDPLDTCVSILFQSFSGIHYYAYNQTKLGDYYRMYQHVMRHHTDTLGIEVMDIHYEDLVADQEGWSRRLVEYCGLDWHDACLDFHKNKRHVSTASSEQVNKPIYKSSIQRWRHYEKYLTPLLKALRYQQA